VVSAVNTVGISELAHLLRVFDRAWREGRRFSRFIVVNILGPCRAAALDANDEHEPPEWKS
jgi:hypothetical protein